MNSEIFLPPLEAGLETLMEYLSAHVLTCLIPACFIASIIGALLYMPTVLEVPIVGTLFGYSTGVMAAGPALALLLAGPSMSLPNMIVIWRVIGARKAGVYILLVVLLSTLAGMIYGAIV